MIIWKNKIYSFISLIKSFFKDTEKTQSQEKTEEDELFLWKQFNRFFVKTIRNIMTPRTQIHTLDVNTSLNVAIEAFNKTGYTRIPIYEEKQENIIGLLHAKDILKHISKINSQSIRKIMRNPVFVSYSQPIYELLRELQSKRTHLAIVIDEYGGVDGLVTIEDIFEEIFGDINDEFDKEEFPKITKVADGTIINAEMPLDEFNEYFHKEFHKENIETIGGFICYSLERIPAEKEVIELADTKIEVISSQNKRLLTLKIFH